MQKWLSKSLTLLVLLTAGLATPYPAYSAVETEKCGNGIDDPLGSGGSANGTKGSCPSGYMDAVIGNGCDKKCPGVDQDNDGYTSDGTLGTAGTTSIDCDDADRRVIPGKYVPNSWTTPTGYKLCQTNGSYGSTTLNAVTPLAEGSNHNYYIDCTAGSDTLGAGTYASPYKTLGKVSGGSSATGLPASPKTLDDDDYVYLLAGTCNTTITSSGTAVVGDFTQAGSSGHRIVIKNYPGSTASIENSAGMGLWFKAGANYYQLDDLQGTSDAGGGGSGSWILVESSWVKMRFPYVHDFQGNGNNNNSALYCSHTNGCQIEYPYIYNFQVDSGNVQGVNAVKWLDNYNSSEGDSHYFRWGTIWNPTFNSGFRGSCLRQKHGTKSSDVPNKHYIQYSTFNNCTDVVWWNGSSMRFDNNLVGYNGSTGNGNNVVNIFDDGDTFAHEDNEITNNTIDGNANLVNWTPKYAGTEHLKVYRNVFLDHRNSYSDGNLNGMMSIDGYGSDAQRLTFLASYLLSDENCWYNITPLSANFSFFRITSGGHGPAGAAGGNQTLTNWKAAPHSYDANSCEENPLLDGNNQPTSANCSTNRGRQYTQAAGGSTTTTTAASTTTSVPAGNPGSLAARLQ